MITINASSSLRTLYPEIEPYQAGQLRVSDKHEIYYEESGNPKGKPVVFLHGGPGASTRPEHRCFFDPAHYRIVLFDQRGTGKSTPHALLEENTTWHLVEDMERLRLHLGINKWIVFGGSWGSTLALTYAVTHRDRVAALVLRGVFLFEEWELNWMYQNGGAGCVYPDEWEKFVGIVPQADRTKNMIDVYKPFLTHTDKQVQQTFARLWTHWEASVIQLLPDAAKIEHMEDDHFSLSFARIENHYLSNRGFFSEQGFLIKNAHRLQGIPGVIVHGRYDMVCPIKSSWMLHKAWPDSELKIVPDAGHTAREPGITHHLIETMDRFRSLVY